MAWVEKRGDCFRVRYRLPDGTLYSENGFATQEGADNRAADVASDQRRDQFVDPRLAQTTIDEWIQVWSEANNVSDTTWATYDSHIRNHILPRWSGTALGDIQRIMVKGWANKKLRKNLADRSVKDVVVLFSMILSEAVDEGLIGANPCRKLRLAFEDCSERLHASADEIDAIAGRVPGDDALMIITAAYTGMRWGEIAGLQWIRTYLDEDPRIRIDPEFGALHEVRGRLELGPPKTPASVRPIHLPPFLVELLTEHRNRNPKARFVFTGADGGLHRRSNFRRRVWLPALTGNKEQGWGPIQAGMHFHDLRHTHKTWLIEDDAPRVLQLEQARWETYGTWTWVDRPRRGTVQGCDHIASGKVVTMPCSQIAPKTRTWPTDQDRRQAM